MAIGKQYFEQKSKKVKAKVVDVIGLEKGRACQRAGGEKVNDTMKESRGETRQPGRTIFEGTALSIIGTRPEANNGESEIYGIFAQIRRI